MELTGNPFVDTGLMVLTALAGKERVSDLSFPDIRAVFGDGSSLVQDNQRLKCFTMVFGTNGPLTQYAYKKAGKNVQIYRSILRQLLHWAEREGAVGPRCDLTGIPTDFDFHAVCARALTESGLSVPDRKWLGRDFVPMGGSLGNDAQALPSASRPLYVSALALFALQYLPLGVFLFKGRLACYQSTANGLTTALVSQIVEKNKERLSLGDGEILGKGKGTGVLLDFLLRHFEHLEEAVASEALPANTELLLWLFSNSGTGADCATELIPEAALRFIRLANSSGFGSEIRHLAAEDSKDTRSQLMECIRNGRDYPGLYAFKKRKGASPEFYEFYQRKVLDIPQAALQTARKLGSFVASGADKKKLKEIRKPESLKSPANRNYIRKVIIDRLSPAEYEVLFPSRRHPIRSETTGWQLLRYYLSNQTEDARPFVAAISQLKTTHPKIVQIAETYRSTDPRKIKNLLDRMAQRKIGVRWLQDKFCRLAEVHPEWSLGEWDEFVCDENGNPVVFELLFQLRLYMSNLYRELTIAVDTKGEVA